VIVATAPATARGTAAVVTSRGRLVRVSVLEIPALPPSAHSPALAGGAPISEFVGLEAGETVVGLAAPEAAGAGLALGTTQGVVKRVAPDYPANATDFEVISLKDGDQVVGAVQLASEDADLVFISSDAQLLRFPAAAVRPQGRAAGGMAGIRLGARAAVIWFGAVRDAVASAAGAGTDATGAPGAVVVTVAGSSRALPGTAAATVKVSPYLEFPAKGRATGGVRCQRFLKGEDSLVLAWGRPGPGSRRNRGWRPGGPACRRRPPGWFRRARPPAAGRARRPSVTQLTGPHPAGRPHGRSHCINVPSSARVSALSLFVS
jgi:DNA gyrase subunit A